MTYASSYAGARLSPQHEAARSGSALPPPPPRRMHWSTLLLVGGMSVCAIALLATLAGVPGRLGYDDDAAPKRVKPGSSPLSAMSSVDSNLRWVAQASGPGDTEYLGLMRAINAKEASIPAMITAITAMDAAVRAIDSGLGSVEATTKRMNGDMAAMSTASAASGRTMGSLDAEVGLLSKSMLSLAASTQQLTQRMSAVEQAAAGISTDGTSEALAIAKELNQVLPAEVPTPDMTAVQGAGAVTG